MRIIDTHNHIWRCRGQHFTWITDALSDIRRDFLIEELLTVLEACKVDGSILVQAMPVLSETEWLLDVAEHTDKVKGVIGWVDVTQGRAVKADLGRLQTRSGYLKGIRYMSQGLPASHLLTREFIDGVRCVGEHGLVYELLITPSQLSAASRLITACPDMTFVIEHIGKPAIRTGDIAQWREELQQIAERHPQLFCKLSGMTTEADYQNWSDPSQAYRDIEPYISAVFAAFGGDRVMFGSDWPVSLLALSYADTLSLCQRYLTRQKSLSPDTFFHLVAESVYGLK